MRAFISIILLVIVLLPFFKSEVSLPFLTDGVSTLKDYREFSEKKEFKSICWIKCGGAVFTGGIIEYVGNHAIILTTCHGFQNILEHGVEDASTFSQNFSHMFQINSGVCFIGFKGITDHEKTFPVSHVILNPHYVRLFAQELKRSCSAHDYALVVADIPIEEQKKYPPLALPKQPLTTITCGQFCGYGTRDKRKRALGLFGGTHETIFPDLRKAMLVYPFFDPKANPQNDPLVHEWTHLGKPPTGRAEPGDSGAPVLFHDPTGHFFTAGVINGVQFNGNPDGLETAPLQEQFENISTTVSPIVTLKKDGLYYLSKTFKTMLEKAKRVIKDNA